MDELRPLPERGRQRSKAERLEEVFAVVNHVTSGSETRRMASIGTQISSRRERRCCSRIPLGNLLFQSCRQIDRLVLRKLGICRRDNVVNVSPFLRPHISQQLSRNESIWPIRCLAILCNQASPHIFVQLAVKRLKLRPDRKSVV